MKGEGESEEVFEERLKRMQACDLAFGSGNRTCLGRPLALIELYKVVAAIFGRYEVCDCVPLLPFLSELTVSNFGTAAD